jgi:hypothetical protein
MVGKIGTARQAHGLALAAAAALLLTSGTAFAQFATNGGAPSLDTAGNATPAVGATGIPFGATETGGGGLSPVPFDTTTGLAPMGSDVSSAMGTGGLGVTGGLLSNRGQSSNGGLSPMSPDTTSALNALGSGVMGAAITGSLGTTGTPATISGGLSAMPLVPTSGVEPFGSAITGPASTGGLATAGTTASGIQGTTSSLGGGGGTSPLGGGRSLGTGVTSP